MAVKDRAVYTPALAGLIDLDPLGMGSDDAHAPVQLDGTFHGPGPGGVAVFQPTGTAVEAVSIAVPAVGEWWRDD